MPQETALSCPKIQAVTDPALVVDECQETGADRRRKTGRKPRKGRLPALLLRALCRLVRRIRSVSRAKVGIRGRSPTRWWSLAHDGEISTTRMPADVINDHWNGLMDLWELRKDELQRRLADDGLLIEPRLDKLPGGGAGNKTSYRLGSSL